MKVPGLSPHMQDALDLILELTDKCLERDREIEVLTRERDNALLRIEELERTHTDKWDRYGGVHPNA